MSRLTKGVLLYCEELLTYINESSLPHRLLQICDKLLGDAFFVPLNGTAFRSSQRYRFLVDSDKLSFQPLEFHQCESSVWKSDLRVERRGERKLDSPTTGRYILSR